MQRTIDTWAREALADLAAIPGVRRAGLALSHGGGRQLVFVASDRPERDGDIEWCTIDGFNTIPMNQAIASGAPVIGTRQDLAVDYPDFMAGQPAESTAALGAVPITAGGQVIGAFVVFFSEPQRLDADQRAGLVALGDRLGERLRAAQRGRTRRYPSLADEPVPPGAHAKTTLVPHDPRAVRDARTFLHDTLAGWGVAEDTVATAVLCVSELVTNALMHTATDCEVRVVLVDDLVATTVRDGGGHVPAPGRTDDPLQVHGRGLQLVEALADRRGSGLDEEGTTVWFELET